MTRLVFYDLDNLRAWKMRNGAHHQIFELFKRARDRGWHCACATVTNAAAHSGLTEEGWHLLRGVTIFETLAPEEAALDPDSFAPAIERMITACPADIALVLAPSAWINPTEVWLVEALAASSKRLVVLVADAQFPTPQSYGDMFERYARAISKADVLAPSAFIAARIKRSWNRKARVSPNLFSLEALPSAVPGEQLTLINPHPPKGGEIVVELARRRPDWQFLFVEGWPTQDPRAEAGNITQVPFQTDLKEIWRRSRLLLVPSLCEEAFGRVVIEAQAHGVPVLAHDIGGLPEAVGEGGRLVDFYAEANARLSAWEEALNELLDTGPAVLAAGARRNAAAYLRRSEVDVQDLLNGWAGAAPERGAHRAEGGTLILSPHPDDAAFSLGGALATGQLPQPCCVLTIFGMSNYADGDFQHEGALARVTERRQCEDFTWASVTGVELVYLKHPEASLRKPADFESIFAPLEPSEQPDAGVMEDIAAHIRSRAPSLVIAPLGLGSHRDHGLIRRAAEQLVKPSNLAFFEDLPYACHVSATEFAAATADAPVPVTLWFEVDEIERKLTNAALYGSQADPDTLADIADYTGAMGCERIWMTEMPQ